jgi:hypothetical protein
MASICQRMNMPRGSSLNICKVCFLHLLTAFYCLTTSCYLMLFIMYHFFLGEAESGLERLHQCAEKELQVYLEAETPLKDFNDFRTKLAGLTR